MPLGSIYIALGKCTYTSYGSLISNYHKLKKYILITMNYCNIKVLLPLEDDGLTVDNIILVYFTHSLIGYTMKERNCKFRPCHGKLLIEFFRRPC